MNIQQNSNASKGKGTVPPLGVLDRVALPLLLAIAPLLLVFPFSPPTSVHPELEQYLEHYFVLCAIWAVWQGMRKCLILSAELRSKSSKRADRNLFDLAKESGLIILPSILVMGLLLPFKVRFEENGFYLLLAAMLLEALADSIKVRGAPFNAIFVNALARPIYSYLAFQAAAPVWSWQPAVIGCAFSLLILAADIVPFLTGTAPSAKPGGINRLYSGLLVGAPTLISALVYLDQLPKHYLLTFIILPFIFKVINYANNLGSQPFVARVTCGLPYLFLLLLTGLGYI